jgi:phosphoglycolate phosphatase-like HAD superfamily hydrolase
LLFLPHIRIDKPRRIVYPSPVQQYNTYIFDLDGTITDTVGTWVQIYRDCLEHLGIDTTKFSDVEVAQHTHSREATMELGVKPEEIATFFEHFVGVANRLLPDSQLFPLAYETLVAIHAQGKKLGIASTMDRAIFEPTMQRTKLCDVVQVAIAGDDVPNRKPAPDGILKALADLGVPKSDFGSVVYVGDKDTDIQAAHNAGIDAILFFPPNHEGMYDKTTALQCNPQAVITSWQELLDSISPAALIDTAATLASNAA